MPVASRVFCLPPTMRRMPTAFMHRPHALHAQEVAQVVPCRLAESAKAARKARPTCQANRADMGSFSGEQPMKPASSLGA